MQCSSYSRAPLRTLKRWMSNASCQPATTHSNNIHENTVREWETKSAIAPKVIIPARIQRGPTDILKALASTVGTDETAAHYKFMDDPLLLPLGQHRQRICAMSKDSGRKAARYLATKYAPLFRYEPDEPRISSFRPSARPTDFSSGENLTEGNLLHFIKQGWTFEATKLYEKIATNCSLDTKLHLLEYLSFYNCQEPIESEFYEQTYYREFYNIDQALKTVWKSDGLAAEIFRSLQPKPARAYAAVITGMAKYSYADEAFELFDEFKLKPGSSVRDPCFYEHLIDCCANLSLTPERTWALIIDLLKTGANAGLKPRAKTFNSVLAAIYNMPRLSDAEEKSLMVLREMRAAEVEPSLATYFFLLSNHRNRPTRLRPLFEFALTSIENKTLKFEDQRDSLFFPHCATLLSEYFDDKSLGYRLHAVLKHSTNFQFLNELNSESDYYKNLIKFLSRVEQPAVFMNFFESVVPFTHDPRVVDYVDIIENLAVMNGHKYVARFYPLIVASANFPTVFTTIKHLTRIMLDANDADFDTKRQFGDIAYDIKEKIESARSSYRMQSTTYIPRITRHLIDSLAKICENAGQIERSKEIAKLKLNGPE